MDQNCDATIVPSDVSAAEARLETWWTSRRELGFVYLRQGGGLIQSGRARLASLDESTLKLAAGAGTLLVVHHGALLMQGPQWFFEPNLSGAYQVEGVSIALPNQDWLFLTEAHLPDDPAISTEGGWSRLG